jgi:predicted subunit of tRNA(5-methylaminomethyl-2-thiouridylate) methyltransferase
VSVSHSVQSYSKSPFYLCLEAKLQLSKVSILYILPLKCYGRRKTDRLAAVILVLPKETKEL